MKLNDLPYDELKHMCSYLGFEDKKALSEVSTSMLKIRPDFTTINLKEKRRVLHLKNMPKEIILELPETKVIYKKANIEKAWKKSFSQSFSLSAVAGSPVKMKMEAYKVYGGGYDGRLFTLEYNTGHFLRQGDGRRKAVVTVVHSFAT